MSASEVQVSAAARLASGAVDHQFTVAALAGDAARDVDGRVGSRVHGAGCLRGGVAGALRRHRQPAAQPGPAADRERIAGRRPRQGDRGHRLFRRQRNAGESGPVDLHRQPGRADAAARRAREGGRAWRTADVVAHRQPTARAGAAPPQRQLAADLQEPGADRLRCSNDWAPCCSSSADSGWR